MNLTKCRSALLLTLLTIGAYGISVRNSFVWDDDALVRQNAYIRNLSFVPAIFTSDLFHQYSTKAVTHYRPAQALTFMLDYAVWGLNPAGYHLTNVLLHLACVIVCGLFIETLTKNRALAVAVAALLAVHPVNANAIAYIAGRADSLAFACMLAALCCFVRSRESTADRHFLYSTASLILATVGLFSRENAMLLPVLIFLVQYFFPRAGHSRFKTAALAALPYLLLTLTFACWRHEVLAAQGKSVGSGYAVPVAVRAQLCLRSLATYAGLLLWPAHLQMERQLVLGGRELQWLTLAGGVVALGWIVATYRAWRRQPVVAFGLTWAAVTLLPLTGLLSLNATTAEHWLYVPSVGIYLALGAAIFPWLERCSTRSQRTAQVLFVCALLALTVRTAARCRDWETPASLYTQTKAAAPYSASILWNLGKEVAKSGNTTQAVALIKQAEKLDPNNPHTNLSLARLHADAGNLEAARQSLLAALSLDPANVSALLQLADLADRQNQFEQANRYYIRAESLTADIRPRIQHADMMREHRRLSHALALAREAEFIEPGNAAVHNLIGAVLCEMGQIPEAEAAFAKARKLDRHSADADINLGRLALLQEDYPTAEIYFNRALRRQADDGRADYHLGLLLWKRGQLAQAREHLKAALSANPENPTIPGLLVQLERGQPYVPPTNSIALPRR